MSAYLFGRALALGLFSCWSFTSHAADLRDRGVSTYFGPSKPIAQGTTSGARPWAAGLADPQAIDAAARRNGVPIALARAVMRIESGGDCRARSKAGAVGVMQVLPATARAMGVAGPLTDCDIGAEAGARYLKKIIARHGTGCAAVSLYERGEAAHPVCTAYGRKVLQSTRL